MAQIAQSETQQDTFRASDHFDAYKEALEETLHATAADEAQDMSLQGRDRAKAEVFQSLEEPQVQLPSIKQATANLFARTQQRQDRGREAMAEDRQAETGGLLQ